MSENVLMLDCYISLLKIWEQIAKAKCWDAQKDRYEYVSKEIEPLEYDGDHIDAVLFFGDGTIEFHLKKEEDAYCWDTFPIKLVEDILKRLNT